MDIGSINHGEGTGAPAESTSDMRRLTPAQLLQLGVSELAYVKQVELDGDVAYAIHAADGEPMAVAADQELAVAAILQHEMVPALVH